MASRVSSTLDSVVNGHWSCVGMEQRTEMPIGTLGAVPFRRARATALGFAPGPPSNAAEAELFDCQLNGHLFRVPVLVRFTFARHVDFL
jgi:hypothetical protein